MTDHDRERGSGPEIATSTLAEIYAQQGLHDRALEIYRRIARRSPDDARVAERIAELERARAADTEAEPADTEAEPAPLPEPDLAPAADPEPDRSPPLAAASPAPPAAEDPEFLAWLGRR